MAIFDDTQFLLSHIQNSFATSDDSGEKYVFTCFYESYFYLIYL